MRSDIQYPLKVDEFIMFKLDQMSILDLFYKAYHELAQRDIMHIDEG